MEITITVEVLALLVAAVNLGVLLVALAQSKKNLRNINGLANGIKVHHDIVMGKGAPVQQQPRQKGPAKEDELKRGL